MKVVQVHENPTIARLTRLTRELERCATPQETLRVVQQAFSDAHGFIASVLLSTRGLAPGCFRVVDMELDVASRANGDRLDQTLGRPPLVRSGGLMAAIIRGHAPRIVQDIDWSRDPSFGKTLSGYSSVMAIPLASHRSPIDWAILLRRAPAEFTESDLERAVERAAVIGALLENQILAGELTRANERLDRDARQLGDLQRALLPHAPPHIAGLEIAASYETSARAGGDLYDFFPLVSGDRGPPALATSATAAAAVEPPWCLFIGDAAGHGLATAVVIAIVQAVLRAHPVTTASPATLLAHANRQLCDRRLGGFVTAFLAVFEPRTRRLTYANAGHPPPLLQRPSTSAIAPLNQAGSYPLGIDESETFTEAVVQLERADTLVLYTDGIGEARGRDNELFGVDRLRRVLRTARGSPADVIDALRQAVRAHEDSRAIVDDQTLVVARIL